MSLPEQTGSSSLLSFSNQLAETVERVGGAVVAVNARTRIASSGIHWRPGIVVVADHTLKRAEEITVVGTDGRTLQATLAGRDPGTDLAVLRLPEADLAVAEKGDAAELKVGHLVMALARGGESGVSASLGTVCSLSGAWRTWRGGQIDRLIRLDVNLYPGFSGGPLVNLLGQVVGMNTVGLSRSTGLTIPASTIDRVIDQLLATGRVARGYLGIGMQPVHLPEQLKTNLNLTSNGGVIVVNLESGGPAEQAGVMIGDIFVALDSVATGDTEDILALLSPERVGKTVPVRLVRGGQLTEVALTIGERPHRGT